MDNKTLARLFMEDIKSKSFEQLVAELEQAEPTGLGEVLGVDYIYHLLNEDEYVTDIKAITAAQSGCHRFVATDYLAELVLGISSSGAGIVGKRVGYRNVDVCKTKILTTTYSDAGYFLAA